MRKKAVEEFQHNHIDVAAMLQQEHYVRTIQSFEKLSLASSHNDIISDNQNRSHDSILCMKKFLKTTT